MVEKKIFRLIWLASSSWCTDEGQNLPSLSGMNQGSASASKSLQVSHCHCWKQNTIHNGFLVWTWRLLYLYYLQWLGSHCWSPFWQFVTHFVLEIWADGNVDPIVRQVEIDYGKGLVNLVKKPEVTTQVTVIIMLQNTRVYPENIMVARKIYVFLLLHFFI